MCKILVAGSLCVDYYYPAGRDIPLIFPGGKGVIRQWLPNV